MNEMILTYLWTYQYFDKRDLISDSGNAITVLHPGIVNKNQGPDFSQARIQIDDLEWFGNVELHVNSRDWASHHEEDKRYDSAILHVVWNHDTPVYRTDGTQIPTIELKNRVSKEILTKAYQLIGNLNEELACKSHWNQIPSLYMLQMWERGAAEKLESKAKRLVALLAEKKWTWEELLWRQIAISMMRKINREPMEHLLNLLPYKLLYRYRDHEVNLEALLLGQSGLLMKLEHSHYANHLSKEFNYLADLFQLPSAMERSQWNFLRTRPHNFPQVRLVQLSRLFPSLDTLREAMLNKQPLKNIRLLLEGKPVEDNKRDAYHFLNIKEYHVAPGDDTIDSIIINGLAPWLVAYAHYHAKSEFADLALNWLEQLPAEKNTITKHFTSEHFKITNSLESQGAIWLYEHYCQTKKCLYCRIGCKIVHGVENMVV